MKNKRSSVHYVDLEQAREKLETELLFLKDVNIRDWNVLSVLGDDISSRYSKDFVHKTKQKRIEKIGMYFRKAIKFTYSLALTWKVGNEGGSFIR